MRWLLQLMFRVRVSGTLGAGPRLVVAHCESVLDGVLLALFLPRRPLVVPTAEMNAAWLPRLLLRFAHAIVVDAAHPLRLRTVIRHVQNGGVAVIFPQGRATTNGSPMQVEDAAGVVAARLGDTVVPVDVNGTLYSRFARTSARWPKRLRPRVTITIGAPTRLTYRSGPGRRPARALRAFALQRIMQNLRGTLPDTRSLFDAFMDAVELHGRGKRIVEDTRREPESYGKLLKATLALSRLLSRESEQRETVGVLMPTISTTVALVLGLAARGRVSAMLNYSAGVEKMRDACAVAGVRLIVTSRRFLEALQLQDIESAFSGQRILYVEDLRARFTLVDKLWLMGYALWLPRRALPPIDARRAAVVLFTSGSEGVPKGVVLSHAAMLANLAQMRAVIDCGPDDRFFSALPLYHTFGLVAGALMALMTGSSLFLYVSPLRYATIPKLVYATGATIFFGTSTFLGHYARQAEAGDFQSLRKVITGGEKLNPEVAQLWHDKFGLRLLEGYGATECGPAMTLNTPLAFRKDTVGLFLPGIEYRLLPVEGIDVGGALHVRGLNLMSGYLTRERPGELQPPCSAAGEGWHDTGDIVEIDDDGFVSIVGRTRRFAKIAGEMVSLDVLERVALAASPAHQHAAVLEQISGQGESTVLFTTDPALDRAALVRAVRAAGASDLTTARRIVHLPELPLLGNGKTDYVTLTQRIKDTAAAAVTSRA